MRTFTVSVAALVCCGCTVAEACDFCGCRGGPGWRHNESGKCMSHMEWLSRCGNPPTTRCTCELGEACPKPPVAAVVEKPAPEKVAPLK
jgi:hypothetical protein